MNNLEQIYKRFLEVLESFFEHQILPVQKRKPKMSDLEVISLNLTAEYLNIDSEMQLFRKLSNSLKTIKTNEQTFFSQLCDQFVMKRNYAKIFERLKTRIISKISTTTIIQYINKFIFDRNINKLKISII